MIIELGTPHLHDVRASLLQLWGNAKWREGTYQGSPSRDEHWKIGPTQCETQGEGVAGEAGAACTTAEQEMPRVTTAGEKFSKGSEPIRPPRRGEANKLAKICTESNKVSLTEHSSKGVQGYKSQPQTPYTQADGDQRNRRDTETADGESRRERHSHHQKTCTTLPRQEQEMRAEKGLPWHSL